MCSPEHFAVTYAINPWMDPNNPPNKRLAIKQWKDLYDTYSKKLGWHVELIKPQPHLPDMVFSANGGLVHGAKVVLPNFRNPERQPESRFFEDRFRQVGYKDFLRPQHHFEGEGDALFHNGQLFVGYPFRTSRKSHDEIADYLDVPVVSLELENPSYYHLDTCMTVNEKTGDVAILPSAFATKSLAKIYERCSNVIEVSDADATKFGLNAVTDGENVVINTGATRLRDEVKDRGYAVHEVNVSEFIKAGGSIKCLTLSLRGLERALQPAVA